MSNVSVAESAAAPARGQSSPSNRIPAFDFTKGALVLFMVLYHWLNYFYGIEGDIYKYLRFLTPSFTFITGFLISHVHFSKYGVGSPKLSKRLFLRGLKLLGVFVFLNFLIGLIFPHSSIRTLFFGRSWWDNFESIFISGNVYVDRIGKTAAFTILVPIGYLLMVSALLLLASKAFRYIFHLVCGSLLLCTVVLGFDGIASANLELLTIGLFGVVLGYASTEEIEKFVGHPLLVALAYCGYLAAITVVHDIPFLLRVVGVLLTVMLIYMVGAKSGEPGILRRHILVLGKYSLFAYISQIAILQMLHRALSPFQFGPGLLAASLVAGFALTSISVEVVDWVRPKSKAVDRFYRAVFA